MTILETIAAEKHREVATRRELVPLKMLESSLYFQTPTLSLRHYLTRPGSTGLIAEFKRRSPSKGWLNRYAPVERTTVGYMQAGAAALSMLTDETFFGGQSADLTQARHYNYCPVLRKDFVVNEYQIIEAKAIGADAVLLIAAILTPAEIARFGRLAHDLGLEVLLEIHSADELHTAAPTADAVDLIGVNNRNLHDFSVRLDTSIELAELIPATFGRITESGINNAATLVALRSAGYQGFLLGEAFMRHARPERAAATLLQEVVALEAQVLALADVN